MEEKYAQGHFRNCWRFCPNFNPKAMIKKNETQDSNSNSNFNIKRSSDAIQRHMDLMEAKE